MKIEDSSCFIALPSLNSINKQTLQDPILILPLLFLKQNLTKVVSSISSDSLPFIPSSSDLLHFGKFWSAIRPLKNQGRLYNEILARRNEIREIKEYWKDRLSYDSQISPPLHWEIEAKHLLETGQLSLVEEGLSSAYCLKDPKGHFFFIIKPFDEDSLCINNRKLHGSPLNTKELRPREAIPLYRSAQTDALASRFAELMNLSHITPRARMSVLEDMRFYDIVDKASDHEKEHLLRLSGIPDKEKLCSIQEYAPHEKMLFSFIHDLLEQGIAEEDVGNFIDQENYEEANIFLWATYDNDAHSGNFLVFPKESTGSPVYGLIKIDNSLSFPEKNIDFLNNLAYFPNAQHKLSPKGKKIIADLPLQAMINEMHLYNMENAVPAFQERIEVLQILAQRDEITIDELNMRLIALELENGKEIALSPLPVKEIENLIFGSSTTTIKLEETAVL